MVFRPCCGGSQLRCHRTRTGRDSIRRLGARRHRSPKDARIAARTESWTLGGRSTKQRAEASVLGSWAERQAGQDEGVDREAIVGRGRCGQGELIGEPRVEPHCQVWALLFGAAHRHDSQRSVVSARGNFGVGQVNEAHESLQRRPPSRGQF